MADTTYDSQSDYDFLDSYAASLEANTYYPDPAPAAPGGSWADGITKFFGAVTPIASTVTNAYLAANAKPAATNALPSYIMVNGKQVPNPALSRPGTNSTPILIGIGLAVLALIFFVMRRGK